MGNSAGSEVTHRPMVAGTSDLEIDLWPKFLSCGIVYSYALYLFVLWWNYLVYVKFIEHFVLWNVYMYVSYYVKSLFHLFLYSISYYVCYFVLYLLY